MSHAADTWLHSKGLKRADTNNKVQVELVQRDHLITQSLVVTTVSRQLNMEQRR